MLVFSYKDSSSIQSDNYIVIHSQYLWNIMDDFLYHTKRSEIYAKTAKLFKKNRQTVKKGAALEILQGEKN